MDVSQWTSSHGNYGDNSTSFNTFTNLAGEGSSRTRETSRWAYGAAEAVC